MNLIHKQHAKVFKAFCDENRLMILAMLRQGERCACELQAALPISQSTLSHHMKILCDSGVVVSRKEGRWTHYSIAEEGSKHALYLMAQLIHRHENYSCSICSVTEREEKTKNKERCLPNENACGVFPGVCTKTG